MFNDIFSPENRTVYEIMRKKKHGAARLVIDENIKWRIRFACWITKSTDILSICDTSCCCMALMVTRTRLSITFIRTLSCFLSRYKELENLRCSYTDKNGSRLVKHTSADSYVRLTLVLSLLHYDMYLIPQNVNLLFLNRKGR